LFLKLKYGCIKRFTFIGHLKLPLNRTNVRLTSLYNIGAKKARVFIKIVNFKKMLAFYSVFC